MWPAVDSVDWSSDSSHCVVAVSFIELENCQLLEFPEVLLLLRQTLTNLLFMNVQWRAGLVQPSHTRPQHRNRLSLNKFPTATLRKLKGNMKVRDQRRDLYGDGYILFGNVKYIFMESFDTHFSKR